MEVRKIQESYTIVKVMPLQIIIEKAINTMVVGEIVWTQELSLL